MRTFVQADTVVQPGSYDFNGRQVFQVSAMHLRTDVAYMLLYFPNTLARSPFTAEQTDVAGIRLRIVRAYQTEQSRFARSVLSAQRPLLPAQHRPVKLFQNRTVVVADADFIQPDNFVRSKVRVFVRKVDNALLQFAERNGIGLGTDGVLLTKSLHISGTLHFLPHRFILHGDYVGDERRYIIQHGEHQHDLQGGELRQLLQNRKQQVACGGVQPDERIVHDEDAGSRKQCFGQLKLTESPLERE